VNEFAVLRIEKSTESGEICANRVKDFSNGVNHSKTKSTPSDFHEYFDAKNKRKSCFALSHYQPQRSTQRTTFSLTQICTMTDTENASYTHGNVAAHDVEKGTTATQNNAGFASIDISGPKQGHVFCGCCCDVRRATIVMNIVSLVFTVLSLITVSGAIATLDNNEELLDDVTVRDTYEAAQNALVISMIVYGMSIVFIVLAIYGASKFKPKLVWPNVVYLVVSFIINVIVNLAASSNHLSYNYGVVNILLGAIPTLFFIYPQAYFIYETQFTKTMTAETYPREEQSCCCVAK
jgi:hypothetical protein